MRIIAIYISAYIIMHAISPLLVSNSMYNLYGLPSYVFLYVGVIIGALILLVSNIRIKKWYIKICIVANCIALALVLLSIDISVFLGMIISGLVSPLLIKSSFDLSETMNYPVGKIFGFSSLFLESMAFLCGLISGRYGADISIIGLILVLLIVLVVFTSRLESELSNSPIQPVRISQQTILNIMPAIAANAAFLSFLSSTAQSGQYNSSSTAAGAAIAITAFGYPTGAFLSDLIRRVIGRRGALLIFSLAGGLSGLLAWYLTESAYSSDIVMYIVALIISLCNGIIIPIALTPTYENDEISNSSGGNAMIFLVFSSSIAIVSLTISNSIMMNPWPSIATAYVFGVLSIVLVKVNFFENTDIKRYK